MSGHIVFMDEPEDWAKYGMQITILSDNPDDAKFIIIYDTGKWSLGSMKKLIQRLIAERYNKSMPRYAEIRHNDTNIIVIYEDPAEHH